MNTFTVIFFIFLFLSFGIQFWLSRRQAKHVLAHRHQVPNAFKEKISLADHQKAANYTMAKARVDDINNIFGVIFILILTVGGGISLAFEYWATLNVAPIVAGTGAIATIFLALHILELPTTLYQTFVVEEKFGFNRTTPKQFIKDQIIQLILMAIIGLPILTLIIWIMGSVGSLWWLWAWAILISFSLLMSWLFPTLIAPLFNKFIPLEEGSLKERIHGLLTRCGFKSKGIFVMDGSKRSGHGNAYFTGIGNNKRIVFFDTLVESLDDEELEAVLAHELGHFKCKHVLKMLGATTVITLMNFAVLGWLIDEQWFYIGLGVAEPSNAVALLLFMLVSPVFIFFMQPISAFLQRKFEFEADDFAANNAKPSMLISGLIKLYQENANTLTPDPLYCAFHYSHPPAAIRIAHLAANTENA